MEIHFVRSKFSSLPKTALFTQVCAVRCDNGWYHHRLTDNGSDPRNIWVLFKLNNSVEKILFDAPYLTEP